MKKWLMTAILAVATVSSFAQAREWKTVRFGIEGAYPPFNWTATDGSLKGFDVDIAHALCAKMNAKCKLVPQDWDGIVPSLLARKYDAIISGMSITKERLKKVDFTHKYAMMPVRFVAKKGVTLDLDHANGMKIGVQRATTHEKYLSANYNGKVNIVRYGSYDEAYLDLANGRIAAVFGDASALEDGLLNKDGGEDYQFVGPTLTSPKWFGAGFGIATRKQNKDLTQQLNAAIDAIRADGTYQRIAKKYFSYDVYGK